MKLLTIEVASLSDKQVGFGQPVVVVVVLEDVVELLESDLVEVIVGDALEDAPELFEGVDVVTGVIVGLEEVFEAVDDALLDVLAAVTP